ncbi:odorant receptor 94b [Drosophila virilis]|uniref:Odorant receptor n=1 Tax=Drosophila virilis TaxID=7244 RepID=B4MB58_DROVI|nr:odorant receptor 94b [Drosophila virilis]EDW58329.1 uncharacterized protein Dvir_GJ14355 [Drosophila virilis]
MSTTECADRISGIRTVLTVQRWLGIWKWRNENDSWRLLKRIYPFVLHFPLTFTYIALMWLEVFTAKGMEQAGNVLYMSVTEVVLIIKVINIWYRRVQALRLMDELERHGHYKLLRGEIQFWRHEQNHFKRIFYGYIGGSFLVACQGYISVFYQDAYELPFGYYVPFEWHNPQGYFYAWSYNAAAMSLCCLSNCLLDTIGCYFMFHIALLYRIIGQRFLALHEAPEEKALPELRRIFQLHQRVRILTKQCELLISPYVLSQVVFSAFIICFSGYRLVQVGWQRNPGVFLTTMQFVCMMIIQIFLPCYYGNELTVCAKQLTNSVFNTNWLEYSVTTRKVLNCYMELLKRPVKLRAGVFFEIGLPIFMKTINNAYSFLALLINLSK